jgi:hypothetical protein
VESDKRAEAQEADIWAAVRDRNAGYPFTAAEFGLPFAPQSASSELCSTPKSKKRTASGSMAGPSTPVTTRVNPPRAAKRTSPPSPMSTPRGWPPRPMAPAALRPDPSPTPQPRKSPQNSQAPLITGPKTAETPPDPPQAPKPPSRGEECTNAVILQAILARLEALERRGASAMGPPLPRASSAVNSLKATSTAASANASGSR